MSFMSALYLFASAMLSFCTFITWQYGTYKSLSYHDTPDKVYELDTDLDTPTYQIGEESGITFFTTDGKSHTEHYEELELCKSGKNCIEVYGIDELIIPFIPRQKIVIHTKDKSEKQN